MPPFSSPAIRMTRKESTMLAKAYTKLPAIFHITLALATLSPLYNNFHPSLDYLEYELMCKAEMDNKRTHQQNMYDMLLP